VPTAEPLTPITDAALVLGATMRLTRLITSDDIGLWYVKGPAYQWAIRHHPLPAVGDDPDEWTPHWRDRLVSGLDCPHCVGYWVGAAVLGSYLVARRSRPFAAAWRFVAGTLTLNTLATTIGGPLDYYPSDD
jgi:hypothetical protein